MAWLALLFGLLCAFGGLQRGALAQKGVKFSYPRALERIESLVVSLNESLHRTQEELQEVKLCLNLTKKELGEVQREKESLEAALLDTRDELAATKALHQQEIDELRSMEGLLSNMSTAMERGLNTTKVNFTIAKSEVELVKKKLSEVWDLALRVEDIQQRSAWSVADFNKTVHETSFATSQQWKSINALQRDLQQQNSTVTRLSGRVTQQDVTTGRLEQVVVDSVNLLFDSVLKQEHTTDNLAQTVAEQGVCIARLKHDVEQINIGLRNLSCDNPTSCKEVYQCNYTTPTGYYYLKTLQGVRRVYCEMNTSNCGDERGGWMRVAHIDMTDPRHFCPQGLTYIVQSSKRMCIRRSVLGCSSVTFAPHGVPYTKVCGRARGYQFAGTQTFLGHYMYNQSLEGYYVAGLSVTHGSPRNHIWTFAAGVSNGGQSYFYHCPCRYNSAASSPVFVGENYHCESGWKENTTFYQWHLDDPLWDSQGCPVGSTCCSRGGPWFSTTLTEEVSDDIEVRWCRNDPYNDYVGVDQLEILVH